MNKKLVALLLSLMLLVTALPGLALELLSGKDIYPLKTDDKISWYVGDGYVLNDKFAKWEDSPFHRNMIEMTGVDIDWSFPTTGADREVAFNLQMAGGQLPDIMVYYFMRDAQRYIDDEVIWDLTPYIQKWAPAYYAFLQTNPAYDKAMKTDKGQYYAFGFFREDGGWNDTYLGPVVRQDWLKEQNLEMPKTISEWDHVLRVFKDKYNAQLTFAWNRFYDTGISGAFDAYGSSRPIYYVTPEGKVQLAQATEGWRAYVKQLGQWWKDGLIDQDIFSLDDTSVKAKMLAGSTGLSITSMGQLTNWDKESAAAGTGADWVGMQYPHGDDGTLSMVFGGYGVGTNVAVITKSLPEEKLETALRLLDYAYTQEGNIFWNFGKQGESWDYDEKGEIQYLPLVLEDPDGLNNAVSKYGGSTWSGNCIQATRMLYMKNSQKGIDANNLWFYENEAVSAKWKEPVGMTPTTAESDEMDLYLSSIATYVNEGFAKFVTGQLDPDKDWDGYMKDLEGMKLPRVLEIRQAIYDRYLQR